MKILYTTIILLCLSACSVSFNEPIRDECKAVERGDAKYWLLQCEEE